MKKFLSLVLVLGLASAANAHLIFTVDGMPQPPEIAIMPFDIIELGLELSADEKLLGYTLDYKLSNASAEFDVSKCEFPLVFEMAGSAVQYSPQWVSISAGNIIGGPPSGPAVVMQKLYLHYIEFSEVVLEIIVTGTTQIGPTGFEPPLPIGEVLHTLTITIPEPTTVLLLGLGGLLLRRRR